MRRIVHPRFESLVHQPRYRLAHGRADKIVEKHDASVREMLVGVLCVFQGLAGFVVAVDYKALCRRPIVQRFKEGM